MLTQSKISIATEMKAEGKSFKEIAEKLDYKYINSVHGLFTRHEKIAKDRDTSMRGKMKIQLWIDDIICFEWIKPKIIQEYSATGLVAYKDSVNKIIEDLKISLSEDIKVLMKFYNWQFFIVLKSRA